MADSASTMATSVSWVVLAWRQNEQTFDGFRAQWQGRSGLTVDYAYVYNVNRLFGPDDTDAQPANLHGDNHLLQAGLHCCSKATPSVAMFTCSMSRSDAPIRRD